MAHSDPNVLIFHDIKVNKGKRTQTFFFFDCDRLSPVFYNVKGKDYHVNKLCNNSLPTNKWVCRRQDDYHTASMENPSMQDKAHPLYNILVLVCLIGHNLYCGRTLHRQFQLPYSLHEE